MKQFLLVISLAVLVGALAVHVKRNAMSTSAQELPLFTPDGKLVRPVDYRRWIFVSSGFGMSYSQKADGNQVFTNVFVKPAAYDYFLANGKWPDKTVFVLEEYGSTSQGSINKHGSYQT
jgi:hypothetical protein